MPATSSPASSNSKANSGSAANSNSPGNAKIKEAVEIISQEYTSEPTQDSAVSIDEEPITDESEINEVVPMGLGTIITPNTEVIKAPNNNQILARLSAGVAILLLGTAAGFYKIRHGHITGFVRKENVMDQPDLHN